MDYHVVLLGFIQGLTEFLPVSSSGHLALAQIFLGVEMPPLSYDLVLHVATMTATVLFFFNDIIKLFSEWVSGIFTKEDRSLPGWSVGWAVFIGTMVTGAIGMLIKDFAEEAMLNSLMVGFGLVFTGIVLISSRFIRKGLGRVSPFDGIWVGIAQGIAVMPGVSRSGMTMMAGTAAGISREEVFRFSFLLSIPAILGAALLQAREVGGFDVFISSLPQGWYLGAAAAFVSGFVSLFVLRKLVIASKWWIFGIYCLVLGSLSVITSFLGVW
ncbi:MAG: undecaprenyl-diphosphate phosphatase [Synergistaceae bacterium]|jgi:undecaprenyl-diphosphatase|nr:undecaprenyl-diphosphate phosphatase [Synergistaceae bacterium]MCE5183117.1 undecaprenyl-diphosphate phosphatase [Synergistaceae bacterium]MDD4750666.1 undecaprenyl-diphosphate phosphatase [Synergistaceae bacterium]MDD4838035.1 undecaprenyl-diphosphate phosphatase [Synergistaceae bacterium]PKL04976.1 MAG: undecaprenyl-diphosphate phosphatase [Synergistetes bacterium HGW-Synergistetes-1]